MRVVATQSLDWAKLLYFKFGVNYVTTTPMMHSNVQALFLAETLTEAGRRGRAVAGGGSDRGGHPRRHRLPGAHPR